MIYYLYYDLRLFDRLAQISRFAGADAIDVYSSEINTNNPAIRNTSLSTLLPLAAILPELIAVSLLMIKYLSFDLFQTSVR